MDSIKRLFRSLSFEDEDSDSEAPSPPEESSIPPQHSPESQSQAPAIASTSSSRDIEDCMEGPPEVPMLERRRTSRPAFCYRSRRTLFSYKDSFPDKAVPFDHERGRGGESSFSLAERDSTEVPSVVYRYQEFLSQELSACPPPSELIPSYIGVQDSADVNRIIPEEQAFSFINRSSQTHKERSGSMPLIFSKTDTTCRALSFGKPRFKKASFDAIPYPSTDVSNIATEEDRPDSPAPEESSADPQAPTEWQAPGEHQAPAAHGVPPFDRQELARPASPIGTRARFTYGLDRRQSYLPIKPTRNIFDDDFKPCHRYIGAIPYYKESQQPRPAWYDSNSSEDSEEDLGAQAGRVTTRARFTYDLDRYEKNAMLIFGQTSPQGLKYVEQRVEMLTRTFGQFHFEIETHVDLDPEQMETQLKTFFSRDWSGVGAVCVVAVGGAGETGYLPARTQRCHESSVLHWLTDQLPSALAGKPRIYITEVARSGVAADSGVYSLPITNCFPDVIAVHIPVIIEEEPNPLQMLCSRLGSERDFRAEVMSAAHEAETKFSKLSGRPIQVESTLSLELELVKDSGANEDNCVTSEHLPFETGAESVHDAETLQKPKEATWTAESD